MNPFKSVKDYMKKRKAKADAKRKDRTGELAKTGAKRIKQIRGAYDNADSAFGKISRARKKKEQMLKDIME